MKIAIEIKPISGEKTLELFDRGIEIDYNLKKHKRIDKESEVKSSQKFANSAQFFSSNETESPEEGFNGQIDVEQSSLSYIPIRGQVMGNILTTFPTSQETPIEKKGFFSKLFGKKEKVPSITALPPPPPQKPHPSTVFSLIVANKEELAIMKDKVEKLKLMMEEAKDNGQIALFEKIRSKANITLLEDQLVSNKFNKIVSESQMIEFVTGYEKDLSMTYIKNFIRAIPKEVTDNKKILDNLCIFDNYIILHFDPNEKNFAMTQEEINAEAARRRDPILFGLIKGSRKFYFIGDWSDEYCDLTLDKFIEKYTEEKITLNPQIK